MTELREFYLPSSDGVSKLHVAEWIPEGDIVATLQISHGMIEHILRYKEFAEYLMEQGIGVIGHDHLGHGTSCKREDFGYFAQADGGICIIKDLHRISRYIEKQYPTIPHFMLGHSMGSFFLRRYLTIYGNEVSGAVIMGTGNQPLPWIMCGKLFAQFVGNIKGKQYRSAWMHQLVLGGYNKKFRPTRTASDWLSRDIDQVDRYVNDPYCNFHFSCGAYVDLFNIMLDLKRRKGFLNIPPELPLYLVSGAEDPVGEFGKGVKQVYQQLLGIGMRDVLMKLYPESRHEILNEIDKIRVYEDISSWLFQRIKK